MADRAAEAREEAARYLASQGVDFPDDPQATSPAEQPPPAPGQAGFIGPPEATLGQKVMQGAKRGLTMPFGQEERGDPAWYKPEAPAPPTAPSAPTPIGPPPPPAPTDDQILSAQLAARQRGIGPGGGGGQVIPGGMVPALRGAEIHQGKPVPQEAKNLYGAGTELELGAARKERDALQEYGAHLRELEMTKQQAIADAQIGHARVQAERQQVAQEKLGQIEELNQQAAQEIDPDKFWSDKGAFARVIAAISVGLGAFAATYKGTPNFALQTIQNAVDNDIKAQMANKEAKGKQAAAMRNLYQLHLERLGDQDKAIDATRLALYDNVASQLEAYKNEKGIADADVNFQRLAGGLALKRGEIVERINTKELDDITRKVEDRFRPPQVVGGTGKGPDEVKAFLEQTKPTSTAVIPSSATLDRRGEFDGVRVSIHDPADAARIHRVGGAIMALVDNTDRAIEQLQRREDADYGSQEYKKADKLLKGLADDKIALGSLKNEQGVNTGPEYLRAAANNVIYNEGRLSRNLPYIGGLSVPEQIQALKEQKEHLVAQYAAEVKAAAGSEVVHQFPVNPLTREKIKVQREVGREFSPEDIPSVTRTRR